MHRITRETRASLTESFQVELIFHEFSKFLFLKITQELLFVLTLFLASVNLMLYHRSTCSCWTHRGLDKPIICLSHLASLIVLLPYIDRSLPPWRKKTCQMETNNPESTPSPISFTGLLGSGHCTTVLIMTQCQVPDNSGPRLCPRVC